MSESTLKSLSAKDLLDVYKRQVSDSNTVDISAYANYSNQYSNNSGGSYTNGK